MGCGIYYQLIQHRFALAVPACSACSPQQSRSPAFFSRLLELDLLDLAGSLAMLRVLRFLGHAVCHPLRFGPSVTD